MLYEVYFSPTGGTKEVLDTITEAYDKEVKKIDLSESMNDNAYYVLDNRDICIVAVPSFGGRVPAVVKERLKWVSGKNTRAVFVCAYGNRAYDDTLLELEEILTKQGFLCCAAVAAVTEHSIMRQFGKGRPDEQDKKQLKEYANTIWEVLEHENRNAIQLPGKKPYREYHGVPMKPSVNSRCNGCGLCVKKCPVQAIDKQNPKHTDTEKCISCMRCIHICPQKARGLNKVMLFLAGKRMKKSCQERKENELFLS